MRDGGVFLTKRTISKIFVGGVLNRFVHMVDFSPRPKESPWQGRGLWIWRNENRIQS